MIVWGIIAVLSVFVIVIVCRLLARVIRDVNKWDRRSGNREDL